MGLLRSEQWCLPTNLDGDSIVADLQFPLPPDRPTAGGSFDVRPPIMYQAEVQQWGIKCAIVLGRALITSIDSVATAIREHGDRLGYRGGK